MSDALQNIIKADLKTDDGRAVVKDSLARLITIYSTQTVSQIICDAMVNREGADEDPYDEPDEGLDGERFKAYAQA